ncbi:MAG: hypothetical protein IJV69_07920, partial [Kiritimatiellae bacterium]|nr:hypothetical protein [Kiritimatiellia bacterium]
LILPFFSIRRYHSKTYTVFTNFAKMPFFGPQSAGKADSQEKFSNRQKSRPKLQKVTLLRSVGGCASFRCSVFRVPAAQDLTAWSEPGSQIESGKVATSLHRQCRKPKRQKITRRIGFMVHVTSLILLSHHGTWCHKNLSGASKHPPYEFCRIEWI